MFFICPFCLKYNCNFIPYSFEAYCEDCRKSVGTVVEWVKHLEEDKKEWSDNQVLQYLADMFKIQYQNENERADILAYYKQQGFDLVPIQRDGKIPMEKEWTVKSHKDVSEWQDWLDTGMNVGVKTGRCSNITIIDLDTKDVPEVLKDYKGTLQESTKGYHYFFQYEKELPKTRIDELKIDIENDGGQVVVSPSAVGGVPRKYLQRNGIPKMSDVIKLYLMSKVRTFNIERESLPEDTKAVDLNLDFVGEGNRTNFLMKFGGVMRRELNLEQTRYVVDIVNNNFLKPSLPKNEVYNVIKSLDKYIKFDQKDLAAKILKYLRMVEEATERDIKEITGEKLEMVKRSLTYLVREGYLIKHWKTYHIIKKADWKDTFMNMAKPIDFKLPYFDHVAHLNWGDMVLLGSRSKWGKTTISMNFVYSFVKQGIKPYYICLETGSRFTKTAQKLGILEGEFFWDFQADPTKIELEKNAVTILDWLLIADKAQTDVVLKHFVEQLYKTNGFLIIFMQLKKSGDWFAPNMVDQFPALGARYIYEDESDGTKGNWIVDPIREPKQKYKRVSVPCVYNFDSRRLEMVTGEEGL